MLIGLQPILNSYLYLVFVSALTSGIFYQKYRASGFHDQKYKRMSLVSLHLTTALLTFSQMILAYIMIKVDEDFQIVINSAASWMSTGELIAASWTDRWGSYHLWTWFTWLSISIIFIKYLPTNKAKSEEFDLSSRFFEILLWGGIVILILLIGQRPYRSADHGSNPIGLNPSLLSVWNFLHPPLAFASYTGFFISWVISSYIWIYSPKLNTDFNTTIIRFDKLITRITWVLTSLVLTLGVIWSHEANWGGYWSWDGVIVVSVILWLISGYRLHLHEIGSNQALHLFLGIIGFPLVFFAAWLITSNVLGGLHNYAGASISSFFLVLAIITLLPLIKGWFLHKWTPLSPVRVSDDVARPTGFNIGVLAFNFLIIGNFTIILAQIADSQLDLSRDFARLYPILNGLGFFGMTLGLLVDSIQHKLNPINQNIGISIFSFIIGYAFWIRHLDNEFSTSTTTFEIIGQTILIILIIVTIFVILISEINKYTQGRKIAPRRLLSHLAMLLAFLTIIANGAGPAVETRTSSDPFIIEIGDTVIISNQLNITLNSIKGPINSTRGQTVDVSLSILYEDKTTNRTITVIDQIGYASYIQATWITLSDGKEIYLNLKKGQPLRSDGINFVGINLIVEQYYMTTSIWMSTILFVLIPIVPSKIKRNN
ncbi:MAG: cytochrome c biogenesis protein CcsA [Candidatus Kariarchaeaceae archaeon]